MKRLIAILSTALLLVGLWVAPTQAHVLEADGGISAVLHMPPDDAPIAGKATYINLAFASGDPDFNISDYQIQVSLQRNTSILQTASMQPDSGSSRDGTATVTFPEPGAYRLNVRGNPLQSGEEGSTFELNYSVRAVAGDGRALNDITQAGLEFWVVSISSLAILAIVASQQIRRGGRYTRR
jgi:hypothetical protein